MPIAPGTFARPKAAAAKSRNPEAQELALEMSFVDDDLLLSEYKELLAEDSADKLTFDTFVYAAYEEVKDIPFDSADGNKLQKQSSGVVQRRAPKNPLRSPWMGKFRKQPHGAKEKIVDPALERNPIRGRLVTTILTTTAIIFVFLQSLVYNKVTTGQFHVPKTQNGMFGPSAVSLLNLGGLNTNKIREGEVFRVFWAMWMHSGWLHITFNAICQIQYMWMMEPDWGFWRTLFLFLISGVTGNFLSSVCDPCSTTVGSSGALFGLMGAMIPYCIEYWKSIPRPGIIMLFSLFVMIVSILTGFTGTTDNWAHMGGVAGGLLFGLGTITSLTACEHISFRSIPPLSWCFNKKSEPLLEEHSPKKIIGPDGKERKKVVKRNPVARAFQQKVQPECKCGPHEWIVRVLSWTILIVMWSLLINFLFLDYDYTPPGHVTYARIRRCCCCNYSASASAPEYWTCNYCDAPMSGESGIWEKKCESKKAVTAAEEKFGGLLDGLLTHDVNEIDDVAAGDVMDYETGKHHHHHHHKSKHGALESATHTWGEISPLLEGRATPELRSKMNAMNKLKIDSPADLSSLSRAGSDLLASLDVYYPAKEKRVSWEAAWNAWQQQQQKNTS